MIGRREAIVGIAFGSAMAATPVQACTIVASLRRSPISLGLASARLREFASFLSTAHALSDDQLVKRADDWNVSFDRAILNDVLGTRIEQVNPMYEVYSAYALSEGKLDQKPVRVTSVELLREAKGRTLYQTTFERWRWNREISGDDCGRDRSEGYFPESSSYLAIFSGNRLRSLKSFSDWLDLERY